MDAIILIAVAVIFAVVYNIITMLVYLETTDGKYETLVGILWTLNTLKDVGILILILFKIFKINY